MHSVVVHVLICSVEGVQLTTLSIVVLHTNRNPLTASSSPGSDAKLAGVPVTGWLTWLDASWDASFLFPGTHRRCDYCCSCTHSDKCP